MGEYNSMIRVGFLGVGSKEWMGMVTYLRNLLYAISKLENKQIEPIVFLGKKTDNDIKEMFRPYAKIIETSYLDRKSFKWYLWKAFYKFTGSNFFIINFLKKNNISVLSHSGLFYDKLPFKTIYWIPDFQHLHMSEIFSKEDLDLRDKSFKDMANKGDVIVLSSYDALKHYKTFVPEYNDKAKVLQFVSQPSKEIYKESQGLKEQIEEKYNFKGKFFYLPNQCWKHKNHITVFKAVNELKKQGLDVLLLCSGSLKDYRDPNHIVNLQNYLKDNDLVNNIRLLGLIDYSDVLYFTRNAVSVINPSFYEGWSSTVEEAKSTGKNIILSKISVHVEQNPPGGIYFDPDNYNELAEILKNKWLSSEGGPDYDLEKNAKESLLARTLEYAGNYQDCVLQAVKADISN